MVAREAPGPAMTLGNMRQNGVRVATVKRCGHS
jgi:hypothetical protein